jgi:WD40 repeat protein/serine/threonine protein kinase/tetratricopeptide (TPR) repeat protein
MTSPNGEDDLLGQLAEEWCRRVRGGERPNLAEYTDRYPELADDIRDLFPAMAMVEDLKPSTGDASSSSGGQGPVAAGKVLERLGDFRILREVGRGGMGVVYEAEQESLGRRVALKILPAQYLHEPEKKKRFQREAKATARLHHTNIVPVYGVGEHEGMQYYVMQFINGLGLDEVQAELKRLRHARSSSQPGPATVSRALSARATRDLSAADVARSLMTGRYVPGMRPAEPSAEPTTPVVSSGQIIGSESVKPRLGSGSGTVRDPSSGSGSSTSSVHLPGQAGRSTLSDSGRHYWHSVAHIGHQVAEALEYANSQGIVHRDIKPSNLLLDTQGTVWVTDFGLAKATADGDNLTHTGDIVGTLRYMAPERFRGQADARGDIYSLGLTLYELLVQRPAFDEKDRNKLIHRLTHEEPAHPRRINPAIPRDLETVVLKAIDREPARRYQTASALAEDLKRFLEDKPIQARRISTAERFWRWCRRNPALATATGLAAVALVAVLVLSITFNISQSRANEDLRAAKERTQRALTNLGLEQNRTEQALTRSQKLANDLALEKKNLALEQTKTKEALAKSQKLAGSLAVEEKRARDALTEARTMSARLLIERGQSLIAGRAPALGMLWLARGLEMAPADAEDLQHVARTNLAGLRSEVPVQRAVLSYPTPVEILAVAFSPDGKLMLTGGRNKNAWLWDATSGKPIGQPLVNEGYVTAVAFSPDGKLALTGNWGHTVRLWEVSTGKAVGQPFRHPTGVQAAAFSPDGKTILTSCLDNKARLWETATGKMIGEPMANDNLVLTDSALHQVAFSPDGKTILTGCPGRVVRLWDAATAKPIGQPLFHPNTVYRAAFSPDGKTVWTGCFDFRARLWEVATGKPLGSPVEHGSLVAAVAFRPDGTAVLTSTQAGVAQLWDPKSGASIGQPMQHGALIWTAAFSPDGRLILTASHDGTARLWDADTGRPLGQPLAHPGPVRAARFSPTGRAFVTVCADRRARIWELPTSPLLQAPLVHLDRVSLVAFSPDGKTILSGGGDQQGRRRGSAQLWDAATGRPIGSPLLHRNQVYCAAFSPDGKLVVTGSRDNTARLWDAATGQPMGPPLTHQGMVVALAISSDGNTILTGSTDRSARLWDARTGQMIGQQLRESNVVYSVALSPDSKTAVTGGLSNQARLWDIGTARVRGQAMQHGGQVNQVAFSPDGTKVLTGSSDKTARLWETATGKPIGSPMQRQGVVSWVAFSGDGRRIMTAGERLVRIWDTATSNPVGPPMQHQDLIAAAAFSADGRTVLTGSRDHMARLWHVQTGQPLGAPLVHQGSVTGVAFSPDGKLILTGSEDKTARIWRAPAPVTGSAERLGRWVEVSTGLEVTAQGTVLVLNGSSWEKKQASLEKAGGPPADGSGTAADSDLGWHRRLAAEATAAGHWFAAGWHLDRLIAAQVAPAKDWFAHALRSKSHLKLGRRDRAAESCALALKLGPPQDVRDWFARQSPDHEAGASWEVARWYFDQLIKAASKDGLAHVLRAKANVKLGNRDQAAADYARAVELGPRDAVLSRFRSYWEECEIKEQWQEGLWYLDHLAKDLPRDSLIHARRGKALGRLGQFDKARQSYDRAVAWGATEEGVWDITATLHLHFGDIERYRKLCADMVARFGGDTVYGGTREALIRTCALGPSDSARVLPVARKLLSQYPGVTIAKEAAGMSLYRAGQYQEAIQRLSEALQAQGHTSIVPDWFFLAMAHHRLGHAAEARKWLVQGVEWLEESTPEKPRDASMGVPIIWDGWKKMQLVRHEAEALIRGTPASANPQERIEFARAHVRLRQWDKAVADFTKALQAPEVAKAPDVWAERGRCYGQLKKWSQAAEDFGQVAALQPDNFQALVEQGHCYRELKQFDKAIGVLNRAITVRRAAFERTPGLLEAREALGTSYRELADVQRALGKPAEAAATLLEIRKLWPGHAVRLHEIARALASCVPLKGPDEKNPGAADQAMAALQEAVRAGLGNSPEVMNDPAFEPLRTRDDFKALVKHVDTDNAFPLPTGEAGRFTGHTHNGVQCVAISRDGRFILSGGFDRTIRLLDSATGREIRRLDGHTREVSAVDFSPNGRRAVSGGADNTIRVWNVATGKETRLLKTGPGWSQRAMFSPDGKRILGQVSASVPCLWDADTGREIRRFEGHIGNVADLAFSADGRLVASVGEDRCLRIWNAESGKELHRCEGHYEVVRSVAFAPRGGRAASGGEDGIVCLWEVPGGRLARRLEGSWSAVNGLAFSPDGRQLLSADQDGNLIQWDVDTGKEIHRMRSSAALARVVFSADGLRAVTAGADGLARLWDLSLPAARARAWARLGQFARAEAEFGRAIEARPAAPCLWVERGMFFAHRGDWARAAADFNKALALGPDDPHALSVAAGYFRRRSRTLQAQGKTTEASQFRQQARTMYAKLVAVQPDNADDAGALATALQSDQPAWTILKPVTMTSAGGATLTRLADGSILAGGVNPSADTYTIEARADRAGITAILLEALPHSSFTNGQSGRAVENGNAALSEFTVSFQPQPGAGPERAVRWRTAVSDHQVAAADHYDRIHMHIGLAIDGNPSTYWETWPKSGQAHYAVFVPVEPIGPSAGGTVKIQLAFQSKYPRHSLGRFRLSVTTLARPLTWRTMADIPSMNPWRRLAVAQYQVQEWKAARAALQKAASTDREDGCGALLLSLIHARAGETDQARKCLDRGLAWMADNDALATLDELAAEALTAVLAKTPKDRDLLVRRAYLWARLGKRDLAARDYAQLLALDPKSQKWPGRVARLQLDAITFWSFDYDLDGWRAAGTCGLTHTPSGVRVENTGSDPQIISNVSAPAGWKELTIRGRLKEPIVGRVFWGKRSATGYPFTEVRSQWFAMPASGSSWRDYKARFFANEPFDDLRFDPASTGSRLEIDSMTLRQVDGKDGDTVLVRQATEAMAMWPAERRIRFARGDIYLRQGQPDMATADFKAVGRLNAQDLLDRHRLFAADYEKELLLALAAAHVEQLTRAEPDKPAQAAQWFRCGNLHARAAAWKQAAAAFARGLELYPGDHWQWYASASLHLQNGDLQAYDRHCRSMRERFRDTTDPGVADRCAKASLLGAPPPGDLPFLQKLSERALRVKETDQLYHWYLHTRGMVEYRAGRYQAAIDWLRKSVKCSPDNQEGKYSRGLTYLFLAMSYARLEPADREKASRAFGQAVQIMENDLPRASSSDLGGAWFDWLHCQIIRREAEGVVKSKTPAKK